MHKLVLSSLFVVLVATTASVADPADPAPPPVQAAVTAPSVATPAPAVGDADTVVCKWTAIVGSRLRQRLCLSKRRWTQMHLDAQDFMRNLEERSTHM
ncbi:MAG TPA: hypothetical protein VJ476_07420 [Rhizomicrobium sp.]|nr:hypothetical protein [Rhizomicrobium sp.]